MTNEVGGDKVKKIYKSLLATIVISLIAFLIFKLVLGILGTESTIGEILEQYETVEVFIESGDTAWNIQSNLTPNKDVREMLHYVKILNNKEVGYIMPGEVIIFLKENEGE